jgi:hypothetical protein
MAKDWRCLIGRHEWRVVETAHATSIPSASAVGSMTGFAPSIRSSHPSGAAAAIHRDPGRKAGHAG